MTGKHFVRVAGAFCLCGLLAAAAWQKTPRHRTFNTPEEAVRALETAVKGGKIEEVVAIFGPTDERATRPLGGGTLRPSHLGAPRLRARAPAPR